MNVDFVILWVDGNDQEWQKEFNHYSKKKKGNQNKIQFRDWANLQYIFRAFEQFTPWVRKIHFVTWGHLPEWLNTSHPKLNIVKHTDILKADNLPVFNSNAIEPNIHQVRDLSEKFVLFNDDFFLASKLSKERFFKDGLPCDMMVCNALSSSSGVGHFVLNNLEILNRHFSKLRVLQRNPSKYFNYKYGSGGLLRNLALLPWSRFTGFVDPHMPQPFLKSVFTEVWNKEKTKLEETSASMFRSCSDINQYLFRYWQLASGKFSPVSLNDSKYITLDMQNLRNGKVREMITSGKYAMICLNDGEGIETDEDFEEAKTIIQNAFNEILPNKSSFEL